MRKRLMAFIVVVAIVVVLALFTPNQVTIDNCTIVTEPQQPSLVDMIPGIKAGVVHITCYKDGHSAVWQGSGFVVSERLVVTARHVVEGIEDFVITTDDGHVLSATRAISSKKHDLAFIYIDDLACVAEKCEYKYPCGFAVIRGKHDVVLKPTKLGSIAECRLGQRIITIGSPYGSININSVTLGIVSGLDRNYGGLNDTNCDYGWSVAFQQDSPGFPGNSGCPVFTTDGIVRGILVGGFDSSLIICMPCDLFTDDLDEINSVFIQGKYYREEKIDVAEEAWGYQ